MPSMYQLLDFRKDKSIPHVRYGIYDYNEPIEKTSVWLPMPGGLETSDGSEWEEEENWGQLLGGGAGAAVQVMKAGWTKGKGGSSGFSGFFSGVGGAIKDIITPAAAVGKNLVGSISPTAKSLARGKTINKNKEQFWKGIGFRTFSFTHTLNADNQTESTKIKNIIKTLREAGAPKLTNEMFTWPSDIKPRFYSGESIDDDMIENEWLPAIQKCIIKSVGVDYSSQEPYHQHADGAPTIVTLTLELEEIRQQTRAVINANREDEYIRPSVGAKFKQNMVKPS